MRLSSLTYLGLESNAVHDERPDLNLSFQEIHDAADRKELVQHLALRFGDSADLSLLTSLPDNQNELAEVNQALHDAASALYGRERKKVGVTKNGLCLVHALILEAIQQQFIRPSAQPVPEPAETAPF